MASRPAAADGAAAVEVLFAHATRPGEELRLTVSPESTMGQLKRELVRAVGRKWSRDLNVRLASRKGNTFSYYEDKQLLGDARELVVLGLTLSGASDESYEKNFSSLGYAKVPITVWVDGGEAVTLSVQETSTIGQVKELLAAQLGRPEVLEEGRLAPLEDETLPLPEGEPLRGRWRLKLLGLEQSPPSVPGAIAFEQLADPVIEQKAQLAAIQQEEHEALLALIPGLAASAAAGPPAPRPALGPSAGRGSAGGGGAGPAGEPGHAEFCSCPRCQQRPPPARRGPLELLGDYLPAGAVLERPLGAGGPPLVTALVATHHGRLRVLRDAVASVLGQDYQPVEVLVVVQDVPAEVDAAHLRAVRAEAFARLPSVRIVSASAQPPGLAWADEWGMGDRRQSDDNKPHRAAFVRNAGLAAAKGDYIAFLDDDDVWLPGKLSTMMEEMRREGSPLAASDAHCGPLRRLRPFWPRRHGGGVDDNRFSLHNRDKHRLMLQKKVPEFKPDTQCGITEDQLRRHNMVITSTVVLSATLLAKLGYMNTEVPWEDYDYWVRAIEFAGTVLYVPQALTVYDEEHGSVRG